MAEEFGNAITGCGCYDEVFKEFDSKLDSIVDTLEQRKSELDLGTIEMMKTNYMAIIPEASVGLQQQSGVGQEIIQECLNGIAEDLGTVLEDNSAGMASVPLLVTEKKDDFKGRGYEVNLLLGRVR